MAWEGHGRYHKESQAKVLLILDVIRYTENHSELNKGMDDIAKNHRQKFSHSGTNSIFLLTSLFILETL